MTTTPARTLAALIAVMTLSGCGSALDDQNHPPTSDEIAHAEAQMRKLPSLEETEPQLMALIQQIADAAEMVAPGLTWRPIVRHAQGKLGCRGPYFETDGVSMVTDSLVSSVPISDAEWPEVLTIARDLAAPHGITVLTVRIDEPGNHQVILHSPDHGNEIDIGTVEAARIGGLTGCRYREEDLRNRPVR